MQDSKMKCNMKDMRVLLVARYFPPFFTGAGIRFMRYAPGLKKKGIKLMVFTSAPQKKHSIFNGNSNVKESFVFNGGSDLSVIRIDVAKPQSYFFDLLFLLVLVKFCKRRDINLGVIHALYISPVWIPYLIALKGLKIPIVVSLTLFDYLSNQPSRRVLQRLYRGMPLKFVDCVIVQSKVGWYMVKELNIGSKIEVIPNGVDIRRFKPLFCYEDKVLLRKKLGLDPKKTIILFVGVLDKRKGFDLLDKAWPLVVEKYPDVQLVLVGPSYDEVKSEREIGNNIGFVNKKDRMNQVVVTGRVDNVEDYMKVADLLVFPSKREGMPNVVLEAFATGLTTVMTPFLGLSSELGRPGVEYVLVEPTPEALAKAIMALLADPYKRRKVGLRALKWVRENLDLEFSLDNYARVYRVMVEGNKAQSNNALRNKVSKLLGKVVRFSKLWDRNLYG